MPQSDGVVFVYRSHYEGSLGKRVRRLPDRTALDWFRRGWAAAADPAADLDAWVAAELGGEVYGLASIFDAAREHGLPAPATTGELGAALAEHLYVEREVVIDDDRVLALTDDDEVDLAYFFLPPRAGEQAPERLAYLLNEDFPLPSEASPESGAFTAPTGVGTLAPAGDGEGATYAVLLTFYSGDSICWLPPVAIPGVRLPALAGHLRRVVPAGGRHACYSRNRVQQKGWPRELLALRAPVAPGEASVEPALHRCNRYPSIEDRPSAALAGPHPAAHETAMAELATVTRHQKRDPARSVIDAADHIAQMSMHANAFLRSPAVVPVRRRVGRRPPGTGRLPDALRHHLEPLRLSASTQIQMICAHPHDVIQSALATNNRRYSSPTALSCSHPACSRRGCGARSQGGLPDFLDALRGRCQGLPPEPQRCPGRRGRRRGWTRLSARVCGERGCQLWGTASVSAWNWPFGGSVPFGLRSPA